MANQGQVFIISSYQHKTPEQILLSELTVYTVSEIDRTRFKCRSDLQIGQYCTVIYTCFIVCKHMR